MTDLARVVTRSVALGTLILAACARAPRIDTPPSPDACIVADDSARTRVTFAVTGDTRHVFAQVYESLLELDCAGVLRPGIARDWSSHDRLTWRFSITPGHTFHDGTPVTARTIAQAWTEDRVVPLVSRVVAAGDHDLRITLRSPADARVFADPALSAARPSATGMPVGTGRYRAVTDDEARVLRLHRRERERSATAPDTIVVREYGADLRSAIDAGADVLVTDEAATLAYARARTDYSLVPLSRRATYVLLTPVRRTVSEAPEDALTGLARDAVSADAVPARPPYWWSACAADTLAGEASAGRRDILYAGGDETARELAERAAALAWPAERAPAWLRERLPAGYDAPRAVAASPPEMMSRRRTALAVIARVPDVAVADCERPDVPMRLAGGQWTVTPLIRTREYLVHRAGIGRVTVDGHGTIRFGAR